MKQPKALKIFCLTEMWERFGFYITQAMLVFYLLDQFSFSDAQTYALVGHFTALVYVGSVLGGWVCDRFLGNRYAVLLGGLFLCLGYALLALGQHTFFVGLSLVIIGNSLFKPNISSFLGQFYAQGDLRREAGFTLFYVGINVGVLLATSTAGYMKAWFGWGACFGAASFALLLGVGVFRWGYRYLEDKGLPPVAHTQTLATFLKQRPSFFLWLCGALTVIYFSMTLTVVGSYGLYFFGLLFCIYIIKLALSMDENTRRRIFALLGLFFISILFWGFWFQIFFAVNVFTERAVDRTWWGYEIPTTVFLGLESIFVLILGPLLAMLWRSRKIKLSIPMKFVLGLLLAGLSMQVLAWAISDTASMLNVRWLFLFYFLVTVSELLISPIGLSMVTEYAPKEYTSLLMGGWMLAMGFGGKLTGILANYASIPQGVTDLQSLNLVYQQAFQHYAWLSFLIVIVCLVLVPFLQRMLKYEKK